jgi:hypothetical protein
MTRVEQMEFFNYCMSRDTVKNEEQLRLIWLCAKRAGMFNRTEEDCQSSADFEKMFSEHEQSGESEAA